MALDLAGLAGIDLRGSPSGSVVGSLIVVFGVAVASAAETAYSRGIESSTGGASRGRLYRSLGLLAGVFAAIVGIVFAGARIALGGGTAAETVLGVALVLGGTAALAICTRSVRRGWRTGTAS